MPLENVGFNPQGTLFDEKAAPIPYNRLSPAAVQLCVDISKRGVKLMQKQRRALGVPLLPIDGMLYAMDVGAVALSRPNFSLLRLFMSGEGDFWDDFSVIIKLIDRNTGRLPDWIKLRAERSTS